MPEARLFLERRSYRRRRIMDAVRMLPFLCALLWMAQRRWGDGSNAALCCAAICLYYLAPDHYRLICPVAADRPRG